MALSPLSTSNAGKFHDFVPHIPAAGKVLTDPLDNVSRCMKFDTDNMPSTPPGIKPFRKSTQHEAGKVLVHYGKARDVGPPDMRFGHINNYSDTAKGLMGSKEPSPFVEHLRNLKESTKPLYRSEPLGKSANKFGIVLPEQCKDPNFKFGTSTNMGTHTAKDLIYPLHDPYDDPDQATHERYVKTHGRYEAAEQKKMGYNWLAHGIDPMSFRFGQTEKNREVNGVAQALKPDDKKCTSTAVVKKEVEDFKDVTHDGLGQCKNYGYGERKLDKNFIFGRPGKEDDWGALACMQGEYTLEQQAPDPDVGKATRVGYRNFGTQRAFGVPTVRNDIHKPKLKRVTDFQNYGDEAKAEGLMYPCKYAGQLVHEEDFAAGVSRETMNELQTEAGLGLGPEEFDRVYDRATQISPNGTVCVETFRRAMADLDL